MSVCLSSIEGLCENLKAPRRKSGRLVRDLSPRATAPRYGGLSRCRTTATT